MKRDDLALGFVMGFMFGVVLAWLWLSPNFAQVVV
jgi:hypothetical protein